MQKILTVVKQRQLSTPFSTQIVAHPICGNNIALHIYELAILDLNNTCSYETWIRITDVSNTS
jgi:hypothetical protein